MPEKTPPSPSALEQMAVGTYTMVRLYQGPNPSMPLPNLYVMVNGYQVVIPRETDVVIADQLMEEINAASEGYEHEIPVPGSVSGEMMKVRKRRIDLSHRVIKMGISPHEADEMRRAGKEVYPRKLTAAAKAALQNLKKDKK